MMIFNKAQQYVIDEGYKWFKKGNEQVFQIDGIAGSGKSVVLNAIINRILIDRHRIAPMAYIGQAAIVMRLKGLTNARTIHSWLFHPIENYKKDKHGKKIMDTYLNRPKLEIEFEPKPLDNIDLIIVDEGGAVPYEYKHHIESRGIPVLVAGDLAQLPPVFGGKAAYLNSGKIHHLTEPMRQAQNSGLLYLANRARLGLPIHEGFYGDCLVINQDDLTNDMILHSDIIICGKNATRDYFNTKVRRDILRIQSDIPIYGEKMVCRKNNWNIEVSEGINLANGLIGTVVNSPGVESFDGQTFNIDFKPSMLNSYFQGLSCDYKYLIAPHKEKQFIKRDKYSRGEKFEFANAITCHMSQGGQHANGIYFQEFLNKDIQNNLDYTGITRFTNSMIFVKHKRKYY